jgi:ATP-dependent exoDNAse (exonuclease V) beta subunit
VPVNRLDACVVRVIDCLRKSLESEVGQWILADHPGQKCEFELSGIVEGNLVHASIDRTFIDENVRWIIDYKTSSPARDENMEAFLRRETEQYRKQIETYATLFSELEPDRAIKAGLYFPAIDAWKLVVD